MIALKTLTFEKGQPLLTLPTRGAITGYCLPVCPPWASNYRVCVHEEGGERAIMMIINFSSLPSVFMGWSIKKATKVPRHTIFGNKETSIALCIIMIAYHRFLRFAKRGLKNEKRFRTLHII